MNNAAGLSGRTALTGPVPKQVFGRHHEQCRGGPFVGNIRDQDRQMVIIDQKIVIKISPDFTGRIHRGMQFKFIPIGKRRKIMGQHGLLNV